MPRKVVLKVGECAYHCVHAKKRVRKLRNGDIFRCLCQVKFFFKVSEYADHYLFMPRKAV